MRKKDSETLEEYQEHRRIYMREWRAKNFRRESAKWKQYHLDNKEKRYTYNLDWRRKNREKFNGYSRKCRATPERRKWMKDWCRRQYETNEQYRIKNLLKSRIHTALKRRGVRKLTKTEELTGCSVEFVKGHLEAQFKEGMSWTNRGKWHVDHKIPLAEFDLTKISQQKQAFHYSNLQPMWAVENMSKGKKYTALPKAELI